MSPLVVISLPHSLCPWKHNIYAHNHIVRIDSFNLSFLPSLTEERAGRGGGGVVNGEGDRREERV